MKTARVCRSDCYNIRTYFDNIEGYVCEGTNDIQEQRELWFAHIEAKSPAGA